MLNGVKYVAETVTPEHRDGRSWCSLSAYASMKPAQNNFECTPSAPEGMFDISVKFPGCGPLVEESPIWPTAQTVVFFNFIA